MAESISSNSFEEFKNEGNTGMKRNPSRSLNNFNDPTRKAFSDYNNLQLR